MSDKSISQDVLEKIKDVKPRPRWEFLLKNYVVWGLGFLFLILGSLSFSVIIYMLNNNDWELHQQIGGSLFKFILLTLPYFWLIFLGLFILLAYFNFKHTKKGYKFPLTRVIAFSVALSVIFGSLFHALGVARALDGVVADKAPFYKKVINRRVHIWEQTEEGFLAGTVIYDEDGNCVVESLDGQIWQVHYCSECPMPMPPCLEGSRLRIVGEAMEDNNFQAHHILPMKGMLWFAPEHDMPPPDFIEGMPERKVQGLRIIR